MARKDANKLVSIASGSSVQSRKRAAEVSIQKMQDMCKHPSDRIRDFALGIGSHKVCLACGVRLFV